MLLPRRVLLLLLVAVLPCAIPDGAAAADNGGAESLPVLAPVPVVGTFENRASGRSSIDRPIVEKLPAGNGSINEVLAIFPDVQLTEEARTTSAAGEILPPRFSIAGGKTYQNAFLLDGVSAASLLDPAATLTELNDLPDHPQALFPDSALVGNITVYDSNIPARYGGFTGGAVVVETRDPGSETAGRLSYRTTQADWTHFHLTGDDAPPADFAKHNGGIEIDLPLRAGDGILASYRQLYARIPVRQLGGSAVQTRRKEDYFLKYAQELPAATLRLNLTATPYTARNVLPEVRNSEYTLKGGGYRLQAEYESFLPLGEWQLRTYYQQSRNRREAPTDLRAWVITDRHPWGAKADFTPYSLEGGYGDIEKEQALAGLASSFTLESLRSGEWRHTPEFGLELESLHGTFERLDTTRIYSGAKVEPAIVCGADSYTCSDGEQYFTSRVVYPRGSATARMQRGALYFDDSLRWRRLLLRPGLRLSYDDFMENLDLAPRLAASYDLFGNGRSLLMAGCNRYYGQTLLTYKLREVRQPPTYEYRSTHQGILGDWERQANHNYSVDRFSRLATPYSDEITAGIEQTLFAGRLTFKYVARDNKDEFARAFGPRQADGLRTYTLTNEGKSRHRSARLGWEREWTRDFLSVNATWQETTASNEDYDEILDEEDFSDRVWFDNRILYRSELPRQDFNRPWTVNLLYTGRFPYGFSFTNITRFRSGYRRIVETSTSRAVAGGEARINPLTGEVIPENLPVYEERKIDGGVVFDWLLSWQSRGRRPLTLNLEIYNVFDRRLEAGTPQGEYEIGRQFWAGASWDF